MNDGMPGSSYGGRPRRRLLLKTLAVGVVGAVTSLSAKAESLGGHERAIRSHKVVFHVDSSDEAVMAHAIGGSMNLSRFYGAKKQPVSIEIVANASGILMFRSDLSPLVEPLETLRQVIPHLTLSVCGSSKAIAEQKEGHEIGMIDGVTVVPYGVGRLVELQEDGWSYIHG